MDQKYKNSCRSHFWETLYPLSVSMLRALYFSLINPVHLQPRVFVFVKFIPWLHEQELRFPFHQNQGHFQWVSSLQKVTKVLELQLQLQSFQWILRTGLISFRIDWFDLLVVQGTVRSLLQHHSSKVSVLWHSAFFMVQLSDPYITTGKTIAF